MQTVGWKVSLSNGETLYEYKGDFVIIPGEISPWQKLLQYIAQNNLTITSMSLYTDGGQTFNLPSAGKNPKFHAFDIQEKPIAYTFSNRLGQDMIGQTDGDLFAIIEAEYNTYRLQIWVDRNNPKNTWSLVVSK
jgi:hypothetical protein